MRSVRLLIMVVALGAGVAAAMIAMRLVNQPPPVQPVAVAPMPPALPTAEVLVVTADIPMGSRLNDTNIGWRVWPETGLSEGFIRRTQEPEALTRLSGAIARSSFLEGKPVREVKVVLGNGGFLSAMLPSGMRAVALRVDSARTAGGFILPNDRVDILLSRVSTAGQPVTENILSNIRVLAIDQSTNDTPEGGGAVVVRDTATLELTPVQAELVTAVQQTGTLSLVLRSLADAQGDPPREDGRPPARSGIDIVRFGMPSRVGSGQ